MGSPMLISYLLGLTEEDSRATLTVVASGAVISGEAVSREGWIAEFKARMKESGLEENAERIVSRSRLNEDEATQEELDQLKDMEFSELYLVNPTVNGQSMDPMIVDKDTISAWSPGKIQ